MNERHKKHRLLILSPYLIHFKIMTSVPSLLKTWILQTTSGMHKISWDVTEANYNCTNAIVTVNLI